MHSLCVALLLIAQAPEEPAIDETPAEGELLEAEEDPEVEPPPPSTPKAAAESEDLAPAPSPSSAQADTGLRGPLAAGVGSWVGACALVPPAIVAPVIAFFAVVAGYTALLTLQEGTANGIPLSPGAPQCGCMVCVPVAFLGHLAVLAVSPVVAAVTGVFFARKIASFRAPWATAMLVLGGSMLVGTLLGVVGSVVLGAIAAGLGFFAALFGLILGEAGGSQVDVAIFIALAAGAALLGFVAVVLPMMGTIAGQAAGAGLVIVASRILGAPVTDNEPVLPDAFKAQPPEN